MKIIGFLIMLLPLASYAKDFSVGDYVEYEIFIGSQKEQTASKEILEYDSSYDEYKVRHTRYLGSQNPIVSEDWIAKVDLESEVMTTIECLNSPVGSEHSVLVGQLTIQGCKFEHGNGQFVVYSSEIPFYVVESQGPNLGDKPITTRITNFRFGH